VHFLQTCILFALNTYNVGVSFNHPKPMRPV